MTEISQDVTQLEDLDFDSNASEQDIGTAGAITEANIDRIGATVSPRRLSLLSSSQETDNIQQEMPRFTKLFDFPREIRDRIYELALVTDAPIDFAPLVPGQHYDEFSSFYEAEERGNHWHGYRYIEEIKPALMLLRLNTQKEATPIDYGQEFCFTNQSGWLALYHWLHHIGPQNAALVRNIIICQPAWKSYPKWLTGACYSQSDVLRYFGMQHLHWGSESRYNGLWGGPRVDPLEFLALAPGLRNVHLVLHCSRNTELWNRPVTAHHIHDLDLLRFPRVKVQVLHLICYGSECRDILSEVTLKELRRPHDELMGDPIWAERIVNSHWQR